MKRRLILTIVTMIIASILLAGCGQKAPDMPKGSDALPSSASVAEDQNKKSDVKDLAVIDINHLPADTAKDDSSRGQKQDPVVPNSGTTLSGNANAGTTSGGRSDWNGSGSIPSNSGGSISGGSNIGSGTTALQPTQPAHTHSYTIYQGGTPSTCTTAGTETYACSCGATVTNTMPLAAHSWYPVYRSEDQGWNEDVVEHHVVCFVCGTYLEGMSDFELTNHIGECGGGYGGKDIVVGHQWHSYPVDVFDHYECSVCGARQ
ncbi:MAG: hypothetical protein IKE94_09240 [Aeriscardovia sp.]|nr:hypothetical protein [Aeriscardovia sp.]